MSISFDGFNFFGEMLISCVETGLVYSVVPSHGAYVGSTVVTIFGQFITAVDYFAFW